MKILIYILLGIIGYCLLCELTFATFWLIKHNKEFQLGVTVPV